MYESVLYYHLPQNRRRQGRGRKKNGRAAIPKPAVAAERVAHEFSCLPPSQWHPAAAADACPRSADLAASPIYNGLGACTNIVYNSSCRTARRAAGLLDVGIGTQRPPQPPSLTLSLPFPFTPPPSPSFSRAALSHSPCPGQLARQKQRTSRCRRHLQPAPVCPVQGLARAWTLFFEISGGPLLTRVSARLCRRSNWYVAPLPWPCLAAPPSPKRETFPWPIRAFWAATRSDRQTDGRRIKDGHVLLTNSHS